MPINDRPKPRRQPITSHHLFVPALTLWFGALFGLSSLAARTALFEQAVLAIHLDTIFPFAAPPLGHLARLLLALGLSAIGAMIGIAIGRILASGDKPAAKPAVPPSTPDDDVYRVRARDAHPDAPARRPFSARDHLIGPAPSAIAENPPVEMEASRAYGSGEADESGDVDAEAEVSEKLDRPLTAAERIARAHPSELSSVELIERLAIAMQRCGAGDHKDRDDRLGVAQNAKHLRARFASEPISPGEGDPGNDERIHDERVAAIETLRDTLATLRGNVG